MEKSNVSVTHPSKFQQKKESFFKNLKSLGQFLFNKETREVIGRDGLSWAKISFFYFLFYGILASFFIAFLAVFVATLSRETPRYYAESSIMATRNKINPGLGFRPQLDPEDNIILYGSDLTEESKIISVFKHFLKINYDDRYDIGNSIENCENMNLDQLRKEFYESRSYCDFNYHQVLDSTTCNPATEFGYTTDGPCVAIKLNKIYDWKPNYYNNISSLPFDSSLISNNEFVLKKNLFILCDGEYGTDKDAIRKSTIIYHSANSKDLNIDKIGLIPFYYYPYLNQPGYKSPLVFVQFKDLPKNQLIHIVCKAYSSNIDSDDKLNLRGMVKFQFFVKNQL